MNTRRYLTALALPSGLFLSLLPTSAAAQGVTATAVAITDLSVSAVTFSQSVPAGTNLGAGANINVVAPFGAGSATLGVSLAVQPALAYRIAAAASSNFAGIAVGYSGQTLLTITPPGGHTNGTLRITFTYSSSGVTQGPGSASVDIGNDGTIDWTSSTAASPQVHELVMTLSGPMDIRTSTSASVPVGSINSRNGDLLIEYVPMPDWTEVGDAGDLRPTAQIPGGTGPLSWIAGTLSPSDCDMYWIHIDNPTTFSATTIGGASFDTQLWLFDQHGYGVTHNDDAQVLLSRITGQFVPSPGLYLLALTQFNRDALSAGGTIWSNVPIGLERQPDGPGAAQPLVSWSGSTAGGPYTIFLTGASFPQLGRLVAVASDRSLWTIDPETGAGSQIGTVSSNVGTPANLAYDPIRDVLYLANASSLYSVDLATGSATLIGPFGVSLSSLEFDLSTGDLFGLGGFAPLILYRIDPATATATVVGSTSAVLGASSLVHDPRTNTLYLLRNGTTYVVDRATGATTLLGSNGISGSTSAALHADLDRAYALTTGLGLTTVYALDLESGVSTQLGSAASITLNGLAYVPSRSGVADYGTGCAGQGGIRPVLRAMGPFPHTGSMSYRLTGAAPLSLGFFAFGHEAVFVPLPFPGACPLHISPLLLIDGLFVTGPGAPGSGSGTFTVPLAASAMGLELTAQGVVLENVDLNQLKTSNGVLILQ